MPVFKRSTLKGNSLKRFARFSEGGSPALPAEWFSNFEFDEIRFRNFLIQASRIFLIQPYKQRATFWKWLITKNTNRRLIKHQPTILVYLRGTV